jgi:RimJ/RimL family protein N-acetyltransferase
LPWVKIRPIRPGEGPKLRELRLRSLAEAPDAFGGTFERDRARPPEAWEGMDVLIADDGGRWLGLVGCFVDEDMPAVAHLWGTWVDPAARGGGAGRALMDAALADARAAGLSRAELTVTDRAPAAERLYAAAGFRPTGHTFPLARDPAITEKAMAVAFLPPPPIETERLRLRPYTEADEEALYAIQSREDVTRWLPWPSRTREQSRRSLAMKIAATEILTDEDTYTPAIEIKETGELAGDVMLRAASHEHRSGEIGYMLHPDHQGKGYMTEACRPMLELGFTCFGLRRIFARLEPRNPASARVLERLGMRKEAHLVENEWLRGEWQSELIYAQLAAEWRQSQPRLRK